MWRHDGTISVLPAAFLWEIAQDEGREQGARTVAVGPREHGRALADPALRGGGVRRCRIAALALPGGAARLCARLADVPPTLEATRELATRIGYVRETIFGGMWDFTANLAFKDTAYTSAAIGPHTDGTYSIDPPGFQLFHCLKFDGTGGESTLVDGFKVADQIRQYDPSGVRGSIEREGAGAISGRRRASAGRASGDRSGSQRRLRADRLQQL